MFAGIDIGSASTDVVIIDQDGDIAASSIIPTSVDHLFSANDALEIACKELGCDSSDIKSIVGTGYGRKNIKKAISNVTEISCHAKGAKHLFPDVRLVIDIGGQDSKVIKLKDDGSLADFAMNEKCAAGTGRFLEAMARVINVNIKDFGKLSQLSKKEISLSNVCAVFAESEVISKIAEGEKLEDLISGLHKSIADRIAGMIKRVGMHSPVVMTGGVAKNIGVVKALESIFNCPILIPVEPQIVGALGAALFGMEKSRKV